MSDKFLGAWLVSEYVYNPDGSFAGIVKQKRELNELDNGNIRIIQHCFPNQSLDGHPMGEFSGSPEFEILIDGRYRRYLGPAVIGSGLAWGEGMMTGRGLWPQFGHNFRSFSFLPEMDRQLTGGKFYNATEMIAQIAGVAIADNEGQQWPILNDHYGLTTGDWQGFKRTISKEGKLVDQQPYRRTFSEIGPEKFIWVENDWELVLDRQSNRFSAAMKSNKDLQGMAKFFGPLLEIEAYDKDGLMLESMELLDDQGKTLVNIRRWLRDDQLDFVELIFLNRN